MKISFFTRSLSPLARWGKDFERHLNYVKYRLRGDEYRAWRCTFSLGGHQDVTMSFVKGAKFFPDVELLIDPSPERARGSIAYVSWSWRILRDVIRLKREGVVKKLLAGPIISFDTPVECIIADDAIDAVLLPAEWVRQEYINECAKRGRRIENIRIWPAGVDENEWFPLDMKETNPARRALLYLKRDVELQGSVSSLLARRGIEIKTLTYGGYVPDDYKKLLEWCDFVVELGESETQGLSLYQAWSMNRPTLVHESQKVLARPARAAPYLTPQTGSVWHDMNEFRASLDSLADCRPRKWVLENGTDKISFRRFLDIAESLGD